ncbi:hypothetical protein GSUB_02485 [Geoalkalibacter subterraneus]|uniref:Uncharacterized protein n=1 Tax=Geoalkalibacter subterraneus TaxID=483547 RepID=A0A0B5FLZ7_9BACT|nr:hypothetical protein GSUB_02485 [Geoalkalibacter subterraneus]
MAKEVGVVCAMPPWPRVLSIEQKPDIRTCAVGNMRCNSFIHILSVDSGMLWWVVLFTRKFWA